MKTQRFKLASFDSKIFLQHLCRIVYWHTRTRKANLWREPAEILGDITDNEITAVLFHPLRQYPSALQAVHLFIITPTLLESRRPEKTKFNLTISGTEPQREREVGNRLGPSFLHPPGPFLDILCQHPIHWNFRRGGGEMKSLWEPRWGCRCVARAKDPRWGWKGKQGGWNMQKVP